MTQLINHALTIKNIITKNQTARIISHKVSAYRKGLSQAIWAGLLSISNRQTPL